MQPAARISSYLVFITKVGSYWCSLQAVQHVIRRSYLLCRHPSVNTHVCSILQHILAVHVRQNGALCYWLVQFFWMGFNYRPSHSRLHSTLSYVDDNHMVHSGYRQTDKKSPEEWMRSKSAYCSNDRGLLVWMLKSTSTEFNCSLWVLFENVILNVHKCELCEKMICLIVSHPQFIACKLVLRIYKGINTVHCRFSCFIVCIKRCIWRMTNEWRDV